MERTHRRNLQGRSRRNKLPAVLRSTHPQQKAKRIKGKRPNAPFRQSINVSENETARENVKLSANHRGPRSSRPSRKRGMLKWRNGAEQQDDLGPLTDVNYY